MIGNHGFKTERAMIGAIGAIGVIGGMGPLATVDFMHKVILATGAEHDEDHVPLLVSNDPRIPRRPPAILGAGESPLPRLLEIRDRLLTAGATALVMPCNTAHHWHRALADGCPVPFPSLIELTCEEVAKRAPRGSRVGIIATRATLAAGLFDEGLAARGLLALRPDDALLDGCVLPSIAQVKAGRPAAAEPLMQQAVGTLMQRGASWVLLACTEAPIAMAAAPAAMRQVCVDTTDVLARAAVALWRAAAR
jgi:aspartate racemase